MNTNHIPTPDEFTANMSNWHSLPPLNPEADGLAWTLQRIPVCRCDHRKWAAKRINDLKVSCSGPAEFWEDDPAYGHYGYCAYHWSLHVHEQMFGGNVVTNPKYTQADRNRDQAISEAYTVERERKHLPTYS